MSLRVCVCPFFVHALSQKLTGVSKRSIYSTFAMRLDFGNSWSMETYGLLRKILRKSNFTPNKMHTYINLNERQCHYL